MTTQFALRDLLKGAWKDFAFEPFREGVSIHHLIEGEPALALLKYEAGASVPLHLHAGQETIFVLEGIQSDENGDYEAGTVMINPEGSTHSVWSDAGCVVLIQWNRPVVILEEKD